MPRMTERWYANKDNNSALLIDIYGMQAVFMKLPNFEPLMEVFVPERIANQASQQRK